MSAVDQVPQRYLPMRVKFGDDGATVSWCSDDGLDFDDPFFDETLLRCLRRPFNRAFRPQTPISALLDHVQRNGCRPPDAFIFHMSRCGSTLLSQMFTALPATRVISEATTIDRMLYADRALPGLSAQAQVDWLRAIILSYGASTPPFARYVVKFDAWHVERIALISQAFPEVPWVFLFRNPLEVLVSMLAHRAASTLPGVGTHLLPGVDLYAAANMRSDQYLALILSHYMKSALKQREHPRGMFVDYADLPQRALPAILAHLCLDLDESAVALMLARASRDAKHPSAEFVPDTSRKQAAASPAARQLAQELLMPTYEELRAICWRPSP